MRLSRLLLSQFGASTIWLGTQKQAFSQLIVSEGFHVASPFESGNLQDAVLLLVGDESDLRNSSRPSAGQELPQQASSAERRAHEPRRPRSQERK